MINMYKLGELFCGPGGLALGAKNATVQYNKMTYAFKHVWANDYDANSCETYRNNICPENRDSITCKDVKDIDLDALSAIDGFAYGFPCNDFSIVGEQKGINGRYGALYYYGVKILNLFNPLFFIAENVGGIRSANEGKTFDLILDDLSKAGKKGYIITPHLYKSEQYGVPQTRHRVIIVGIRRDLQRTYKVPAPTHFEYVTCKQAIENPPIPPGAHNNERTNQSKTVIARLENIKEGQNAWTANLPPELQLNVKNTRLSHIYKRLHPDKPSYTITGSGGGGTHVYHWIEPRALTNRERARLQTFPDDFIFHGSKESVRKQIGMAVPPRLAQVIFEAVIKTLNKIEYDSITENLNYFNGEDMF